MVSPLGAGGRAVGVAGLPGPVPALAAPAPGREPLGADGVNWFGQSQGWAWLWSIATLTLLYLLRFAITRRARSPVSALAWYALLLAALLPGIWLLVVTDWDNEAVAEVACWVGTPIALLFVPTAVLCWDVAFKVRLTGGAYAWRALVELIGFVPAWLMAWVYFEMLVLGWFGF